MTPITEAQIDDFLTNLWRFYEDSGRHDMLWRQPNGPDGAFDPYRILVSELMLQQTQVVRVTPKFAAFIERFPTVEALATAGLGEVLTLWSGLGYNRRAKFLHQAATAVINDFSGTFPGTLEDLQKLPGVGYGTAGAIMAYAYNQPVVYLETNIRTVLIHHLYADAAGISDKQLSEVLSVIVQSMRENNFFTPREFYWAMMDYGAHLKRTVGNLNRSSKAYTRQSKFHGSRRQVRGTVLRLLTQGPLELDEIVAQVHDERLKSVLADLIAEGMVAKNGQTFKL